ncbi:RNA-binding protein [Mucilaginibacter daejeonensis]|uniref:RNA recognition motif domain-containing protein n=1 Tax=Mucilaginibacter daejeonensis TaxID=398049 RepID=UPI001D176F08|nr:RNA-binding protein [Mucilaginibacter daejeonensis]UEG51485.1 RNA-binding protein [Mucilaginibacter daejeonensis]
MIKIFIVGFPRTMDEPAIKRIFDEYGDVNTVTVITDEESGQSKGYAFVDMQDEVGALLAIKQLHGSELEGRTLNVRLADRPARTRREETPAYQKRYEKVAPPRQRRRRRNAS